MLSIVIGGFMVFVSTGPGVHPATSDDIALLVGIALFVGGFDKLLFWMNRS